MTNLEKAKKEYFEGRFDTAYKLYSVIYAADPGNMSAMEGLGTIELYKNNPNETIKYIGRALGRVSAVNIIKNITLNAKMAMAYYRLDDMAEAAAHFQKASKVFGISVIKELSALSEHCAMFAESRVYEIFGGEVSEIELTESDPLPMLKVSVNGSEDVNFIIDTGGMEIILDEAYATSVNAVLCKKWLKGGYAGNKKAVTRLGKIDSLRMGGLEIRNLPVHTLPLDDLSQAFNGVKISGIIGTRFLMRFLSTIDYRNKKLILGRRGSGKPGIPTDAAVIPFWLVDSHYIVAEGTVNNSEPMLMFIDTGLAGAGFTAKEDFLKKIGIEVNWAEAYSGSGGGGGIKELDIKIDSLTLGYGDNKVIRRGIAGKAIKGGVPVLGAALGFKLDGLVSHTFFNSGFLTLDFQNMQLVMSRE
jgi:predicted aspartyl protease